MFPISDTNQPFYKLSNWKHLKHSTNWTVKVVGLIIYSNAKYAIFSMLAKARLLLIYGSIIIEKTEKQKMQF